MHSNVMRNKLELQGRKALSEETAGARSSQGVRLTLQQ